MLSTLRRTAAAGADDLATAGRAAVDDPLTGGPLGAAVSTCALDAVAGNAYHHHAYTHAAATVDAWVRDHGIVFAAEAAALRSALRADVEYTAGHYNFTLRRYAPGEINLGEFSLGLIRVRTILAELPEQEYAAVVARLRELRTAEADVSVRIATSFLISTEPGWATEDLATISPHDFYRSHYALLAASVTDAEELERLVGALGGHQFTYDHGASLLYTAAIRLGPDCYGALETILRQRDNGGEAVSRLATMLAHLPSDAAFAALASRVDQRYFPQALSIAAQRFPRRAVRMLRASSARSAMARYLLRSVAVAHPELIAELPDDARVLPSASGRAATEAELPEVLRTPPWRRERGKSKAVVIPDLVPPQANRLVWAPGEQEAWAESDVWVWGGYKTHWREAIASAVQREDMYSYELPSLFALAPEEFVRPHLATATPGRLWDAEDALRRVLARFGDDALRYVVRAAQQHPTQLAQVLAPVTGTVVTQSMIRWLDGKKTRWVAMEWFARHLETALPDVFAAALAKAGKDRRLAETALRTLAARGHRAAIEAAVTSLDERAAAAITDLLDSDPLLQLPARIPTTPNWLVPELLPPIRLRDSDAVLSAASARDVCTMLAMCGPNGDYAGVEQLAQVADRESLAEFVWGVFEVWKMADYPSKDGWVLYALGLLGDDETARRLGAHIRVWPGQSAHARAVTGLEVLTAIGTDVALMQLHGIAEKVRFAGLKNKAREKIAEVAESLDLTPEQLADRLVPDFGLDANGTLVLDYGARGFVIGFDEQLKPTVSDAVREGDAWRASTLRKSLPKPGAKDDQELAPAAYKSFTALKKDVKSAAADQVRRFEQAMVRGRRWTAEEHRRLFVDHPLLWHLTRRLVWATFAADGSVTGSFRIAEDRSHADADDNPAAVADDAIVGIAHPLHLGETCAAWGEVFADYEILQPFPQLQREIYTCTEAERAASTLERWQDAIVPTGKLLGLSRFGWERGDVLDGGVSCEMFRPLGENRSAVIGLDPGIIAGAALEWDEQKITVHLTQSGNESRWDGSATTPRFGDLDALTASELLRELHLLTA
ncbi:DUF4132 domain-containing protein [Nocardia sp. NPDC050406]|uniref:DUF4132 domain-containing protein n=1 Tax=Nocardia sp. NPDC050406 TaxID=3364318 RepID=UPI0037AD81A7